MRKQPNNIPECIHWWASQRLEGAKCGNVSFNGRVLFSYAEPIGALLGDDRVLISNRNFSITTTSHQSQARQATHHMKCVYAYYLPRFGESLNLIHADNKRYWERSVTQLLEQFSRHPRRKSLLRTVEGERTAYRTYSEFFELGWEEIDVGAVQTQIEQEREAQVRRQEEQLKREAEAKEARRRLEIEELPKWRRHEEVRVRGHEDKVRGQAT